MILKSVQDGQYQEWGFCAWMQVRMQNVEPLTEQQIGDFLRGQRGYRVRGAEPGGSLCHGAGDSGPAGVLPAGQETARCNPGISVQIDGARSLPQMTRLIRQQKANRAIRPAQRTRRRFATRYTEADVGLLAEVYRAHERLNGPSTRRILQREYREFGRKEYERLAGISASHIYNLRRRPICRRRTVGFEHTKPTGVPIAERRRPDPKGIPGYIRIDTVHQGDREGVKGRLSHQCGGHRDPVGNHCCPGHEF
jgi:hypothetical protein